jgi:hypothetical protein
MITNNLKEEEEKWGKKLFLFFEKETKPLKD